MPALIALALAVQAPGSETIDAIVAGYRKPDAPGCAIAAARDGRRLWTRAFGSADLERPTPITAATVSESGSVAKQFTAAAILLLAEDGKLSLDDDVRRHIPELPDYGAPITIQRLIDHTNGLRDWGSLVAAAGWERGTRAHGNADALDAILRQRALNHAPGAEFSYNNSGYVLLAEIVRRASGESLAQFSQRRLFAPLGMKTTRWRDDFRRIEPGRAIAYRPAGNGWEQAMPFETLYGPGGLLTTVGDLLIWNEALAANRVGRDVARALQVRARLTDGREIGYARGLFIGEYRGTREVAHAGGTAGYRSWLGRYPAYRLSIAMLCNAPLPDAEALPHRIADTLLPASAEAAPPSATDAGTTPEDPAQRIGLWADSQSGRATRLVVRDGALAAEGGVTLIADGPARYRWGAGALRFTGADRAEATGPDAPPASLIRVAPSAPDAAALRAYAGRYASDELGAVYRVVARNDALAIEIERAPAARASLTALYRDAFSGPFAGGDAVIRFGRDRRGRIDRLSLDNGGARAIVFRRLRK